MKKYLFLPILLLFLSCDGGDPWNLINKTIDSTPPEYVSVAAYGIVRININFSEPVKGRIKVLDSSDVEVSGTISYSGNTMVFTPDSNFARGGNYTVNFISIEDASGNAIETLPSPAPVIVPTAPVVTYQNIADNATNIAIDQNIVIAFSEPVTVASVTVSVGPDSYFQGVSWNSEHTMMTISHDPFNRGASVVVNLISIEAIADSAVCTFPGGALNFTTYNLPDLTTYDIIGDLALTKEITGTGARFKIKGVSAAGDTIGADQIGVCYDTSPSPTEATGTLVPFSGTISMNTDLTVTTTALTANTLYYARAYAKNPAGDIVYGNEITFNSGYVMGANAEGGYVFYNDGNGGGMVISMSDLINSTWSSVTNSLIGTTSDAIGEGLANTTAIIGQTGHTDSAASYAKNYSSGVYSDWYLPSKDEFSRAQFQLNSTSAALPNGDYWTSTEATDLNATSINIVSGTPNAGPSAKSEEKIVRAVRTF